MEGPIRLMAKDAEDVAVIASCLQDALVPLAEMRFLKDEQRFVLLLNRFRWERANEVDLRAKRDAKGDASYADAGPGAGNERVHSGLCVDRVTAVKSRGIDRAKAAKFLNLMTLSLDGQNQLNLFFSGGGVIQLEIEAPNVFLQDFGEAWPTQWRPDHAIDRRSGDGQAAK